MTAAQNNSVIGNQNQTNKKEMVSMTKAIAIGFQGVNSKEVVSAADRSKHVFPVQVKMQVVVGEKTQNVTFGYSKLGGRQTYVVAEGKAPVAMSRAAFMKALQDKKIANIKQVQQHLSKLRYFNRDEFIVSKCECCSSGYVTAANVDYVQRNHKKLSEKLGREVSEYSRICYDCQGSTHVKQPAVKMPEKQEQPVKQSGVCCADCGKTITAKAVVDFSVKAYGKPLCFKPCQSKHPKLVKQNQDNPTSPQQETVKQSEKQEGFHFSLGLMQEILSLDVDSFSEIAKLQREIADDFYKEAGALNESWGALVTEHQERAQIKKSASEASAPSTLPSEDVSADELCVICDSVMPDVKLWNLDFCPSCVHEDNKKEEGNPLKFMLPQNYRDAAEEIMQGASVASASPEQGGCVLESQEQAIEDTEGNAADTKEDLQGSPVTETDHKSQDSIAGSNTTKAADFMMSISSEYSDADVPPVVMESDIVSDDLPF